MNLQGHIMTQMTFLTAYGSLDILQSLEQSPFQIWLPVSSVSCRAFALECSVVLSPAHREPLEGRTAGFFLQWWALQGIVRPNSVPEWMFTHTPLDFYDFYVFLSLVIVSLILLHYLYFHFTWKAERNKSDKWREIFCFLDHSLHAYYSYGWAWASV